MHFYWLILGILATWRLSYFFRYEDGPGDIAVRLRQAVDQSFWASLLDCFYCLSLWMALPFAWLLGTTWQEQLLLWLSLSAGSILLERFSTLHSATLHSANLEEMTHDVLWKEESRSD